MLPNRLRGPVRKQNGPARSFQQALHPPRHYPPRENQPLFRGSLAPPATQTELLDDFNAEDMKGASIMKVEDMVKVAVKGMQTDRFEIRPGQANQLKMMSRLAPGFILKQMSRSVDRMLGTQN